MKLIIDGSDLTGKTTLIRQLQTYYKDDDLSIMHFSYRDRRDYDFYNTMLDKTNFIADRHFLDEAIYPEIFNRKPSLKSYEFNKLIAKCTGEDIKIIILTCTNEELLKRSKTRNEEPEVSNNLLNINNQFIKLAEFYDLQTFDTTINDITEVIDYIERKETWTKLK